MSEYHRLTLAFDFDDVIVPSPAVILDAYNQCYGAMTYLEVMRIATGR